MKGRNNQYFYIGVLLFTCGVGGTFLFGTILSLISLLIVVLALAWRLRVFLYVMCQWILLLCVGVVMADYSINKQQFHSLDGQVGEDLVLEGIVVSESDVRDFNTRLTIELLGYDTRVLVKVPFYPEYNYGDQVLFIGRLERPEGFVGDSGRFFDYQNFLLKDNIRYVSNYPELELVATRQANPVKQWLFDIKHWFIGQLQTLLPEPQVSLLGGLLLGAKSAMGQELLEDFRDTGVIHIVVLSGFNITIVVWFFMTMLSFLGTRTSAVLGSIGILLFALMTGAGSTVVRASLMAFLVIVAKVTGNYAMVLRMLFLAGFLMLLYNPMLLLYDPSFQLSFVATLGLILITPSLERYLFCLPNWRFAELRSLVSATISTQIMVMPLLLWMMGTFPTYAPITNFLILATVPWVMLTGFLAGLVGWFSSLLAFPLVAMTYVLLSYELWVVDVFAHLPLASFTLPPFGFEWVLVIYLVYAGLGYWIWRIQ